MQDTDWKQIPCLIFDFAVLTPKNRFQVKFRRFHHFQNVTERAVLMLRTLWFPAVPDLGADFSRIAFDGYSYFHSDTLPP
jgi:hypothetical protein